MTKDKSRCYWATSDALLMQYHDQEWGVPIHDDRKLFEFLILEGVQAGLSWLTVLRRRDAYRSYFDEFDAEKIARYNDKKILQLMSNEKIIRNHLKIKAAIANAKAYLKIKEEWGSFDNYIWHFVNREPITNTWNDKSEVPAMNSISDTMAKEMKKQGFKFVGSTICYAFMQAVGMVNDHVTTCHRYKEIKKL